MRSLFLCLVFLIITKCSAQNYLLSSEALAGGNRSSLKGYTSFTFSALLQTNGKGTIPTWMEKELHKLGIIQKDPMLTPQGIDFSKMPSNFLTFSIEQLTDSNHSLLPIMRAKLTTSAFVTITNNQETCLLDTNEWSIYVKQDELDRVIPKIFSELLQTFAKHYQAENKSKPIFCVSQKK